MVVTFSAGLHALLPTSLDALSRYMYVEWASSPVTTCLSAKPLAVEQRGSMSERPARTEMAQEEKVWRSLLVDVGESLALFTFLLQAVPQLSRFQVVTWRVPLELHTVVGHVHYHGRARAVGNSQH